MARDLHPCVKRRVSQQWKEEDRVNSNSLIIDVTEGKWLKKLLLPLHRPCICLRQCRNICVTQLLSGTERVYVCAAVTKPSVTPYSIFRCCRVEVGTLGKKSFSSLEREKPRHRFESFVRKGNVNRRDTRSPHRALVEVQRVPGLHSWQCFTEG